MKRDLFTMDATDPTESIARLFRVVRPDSPLLSRLPSVITTLMQMPQAFRMGMQYRAEAAAQIVAKLGFGKGVQECVLHVFERWDGKGFPHALRGNLIPLAARIAYVAQAAAVLHLAGGIPLLLQEMKSRRGKMFDLSLVDTLQEVAAQEDFQSDLDQESLQETVVAMEPGATRVLSSEEEGDRLMEAFAEVVDVKSEWTKTHTKGVASIAESLARRMGLAEEDCRGVRRAGLLHDLGKIGVSNAILDKPGKLNEREWEAMRLHTYYTERILERAPVLRDVAAIAAAHHERLDGSGYHRKLSGDQIPLAARILAVADVFQALSSERPYRPSLETEQIVAVMEKDAGPRLDPEVVGALKGML